MTTPKALINEEIIKFTTLDPNWKFENDSLEAKFILDDFDQAMGVIEKVAELVREMDHHPLWTNIYNNLSFSICTHSAGDKVTELDVQMAEKISTIVSDVRG